MEINRKQLVEELLEYSSELPVKVNGEDIDYIYLSDDGFITIESEGGNDS